MTGTTEHKAEQFQRSTSDLKLLGMVIDLSSMLMIMNSTIGQLLKDNNFDSTSRTNVSEKLQQLIDKNKDLLTDVQKFIEANKDPET